MSTAAGAYMSRIPPLFNSHNESNTTLKRLISLRRTIQQSPRYMWQAVRWSSLAFNSALVAQEVELARRAHQSTPLAELAPITTRWSGRASKRRTPCIQRKTPSPASSLVLLRCNAGTRT
jgi:hypothetical protein